MSALSLAEKIPSASPADLKTFVRDFRAGLLELRNPSELTPSLSIGLARFYDAIILRTLTLTEETADFAVAAIGGYGRRDQQIFSDIDVGIIYRSPSHKITDSARKTVSMLWDIGLEIGHSARSIHDSVSIGKTDPEVKTSFLDARPIAGKPDVFQQWHKTVADELFSQNREPYFSWLLESSKERHAGFGNSEKILEPDVKEGKGGLRDIHRLAWMCRALRFGQWELLSDESPLKSVLNELYRIGITRESSGNALFEPHEFLVKVRNALHIIHKKRHDTLSYGAQAQVAQFLGYTAPGANAVESMMKDYYRHARTIAHISEILTGKLMDRAGSKKKKMEPLPLDGRFYLEKDTSTLHFDGNFFSQLHKEPALAVNVFRIAQRFHSIPDFSLQAALREFADTTNADYLIEPAHGKAFLDLWRQEGQIGSTLRWIYELGLLERWLPEFGYIVAHYNYNVYHQFTTDEHLIVTVEKLESLFFFEKSTSPVQKHLHDMYQELTLPERYQLYWAVFLHDIGKSRGGDHSELGASIASDLLKRIGFEDNIEPIRFLILYHLRMEQIAFRRNLKDPNTVADFAGIFPNRRTLRMLYLLTFADMSAANKNVWTEWKGILLQELFLKSDDFLKSRAGESENFSWPEVNYQSIELRGPVQVTFSNQATYTDVMVIATDEPYRLSQICGVLSVCDVSIFDAQVYTRDDGAIIDQFRVVDSLNQKALDDKQQELIRKTLEEVLTHKTTLSDALSRLKDRWKRRRFATGVDTEIYFEDNREFTIIDIFTADRIGLLYMITSLLSDLGLDIHAARVGTKLDGVADCFYVRERDGRKVDSVYRQEEIRARLMKSLTE